MKFIVLLFVYLLSSCAQQNEITIDNNTQVSSFIEQGSNTLDKNWWHSFNNDELTQLVTQGLQDNLSLKARALRLKSSAIDAQIAGADLYPTINLTTNGTTPIDDIGEITSASFGVSSSWELDFWGNITAFEDKAYWDQQGQQALYRANATLVAGNITSIWLSIISEQEKKDVLADQFQRTKDALKVISRRFAMGKNSVTNIWQQQKLLKSIEVQQSKNLAELYIYQQSLALWLGIATEKLNKSKLVVLPKLPELPVLGIPANVLQYRPDIEQAFAKIKAANENLAVAITDQYPRFTLRANYSTTKNSLNDLFDDWSGNLIASLAMPIFDAGVKKSRVEQRKLQLKALVMDYQQTWLEAIASVNQVLVNEAQLVKVKTNLAAQLDLAKRTEKLTTIQYLNGKTNYLNLLKAQESILSLERQFIDANKKVVINRVLLYRELSHGRFSSINQLTNKKENK